MRCRIKEKCPMFNKNVSFEVDIQRLKNGNGLDRIFKTKRCLMDCKYKTSCSKAHIEIRTWG